MPKLRLDSIIKALHKGSDILICKGMEQIFFLIWCRFAILFCYLPVGGFAEVWFGQGGVNLCFVDHESWFKFFMVGVKCCSVTTVSIVQRCCEGGSVVSCAAGGCL